MTIANTETCSSCPRCRRRLDEKNVCLRCSLPPQYLTLRWFEAGRGVGTSARTRYAFGVDPARDRPVPRARQMVFRSEFRFPPDAPLVKLSGALLQDALRVLTDDDGDQHYSITAAEESAAWIESHSSALCSCEASCFLLGIDVDALRDTPWIRRRLTEIRAARLQRIESAVDTAKRKYQDYYNESAPEWVAKRAREAAAR